MYTSVFFLPELKATQRCSESGREVLAPLAGMVAERKKRFEMRSTLTSMTSLP